MSEQQNPESSDFIPPASSPVRAWTAVACFGVFGLCAATGFQFIAVLFAVACAAGLNFVGLRLAPLLLLLISLIPAIVNGYLRPSMFDWPWVFCAGFILVSMSRSLSITAGLSTKRGELTCPRRHPKSDLPVFEQQKDWAFEAILHGILVFAGYIVCEQCLEFAATLANANSDNRYRVMALFALSAFVLGQALFWFVFKVILGKKPSEQEAKLILIQTVHQEIGSDIVNLTTRQAKSRQIHR